VAGKNG